MVDVSMENIRIDLALIILACRDGTEGTLVEKGKWTASSVTDK